MPYERPYIYTFDADELTDGQSYQSLQVPIQNDYAFVLRRIAGLEYVTAAATRAAQIYDAESRRLFQSPVRLLPTWPVVPGLYYPANSQIKFDLSPVLRANHAYAAGGSVPNYYSQLAFQGSKLIDGVRPYQTPYSYYEHPYAYVTEIDLSWTGRFPTAYTIPNAARNFYQPLQNKDFELLYINILIQRAGQPAAVPSDGYVKLFLLDLMDFPVSTTPVLDTFINWKSALIPNGFPNPTLIWPANGLIKFAITSLLVEADVPATLRIEWHGVNRNPCLGAISGARP